MKNLLKSFGHDINGLLNAIQTERNLRIHLIIAVLVAIIGRYLHLSFIEWCFIIGCFGLVIGAELMNTAIEKLVYIVSPDINPKAGLVKDIAAGAVLICAITAAIIGCVIFIPKLLTLW
jgi:diacylglycerol kinase (ATP)